VEGGEGVGVVTINKKGRHFEFDDYKGYQFFDEKMYRVTPSVSAPGDTNVSDATASCTYRHLDINIF